MFGLCCWALGEEEEEEEEEEEAGHASVAGAAGRIAVHRSGALKHCFPAERADFFYGGILADVCCFSDFDMAGEARN